MKPSTGNSFLSTGEREKALLLSAARRRLIASQYAIPLRFRSCAWSITAHLGGSILAERRRRVRVVRCFRRHSWSVPWPRAAGANCGAAPGIVCIESPSSICRLCVSSMSARAPQFGFWPDNLSRTLSGRCGISLLIAFTLALCGAFRQRLVRDQVSPDPCCRNRESNPWLRLADHGTKAWLARDAANTRRRMDAAAGPARQNPLFAVNGALRAYFMDWDRYLIA